MEEDFDQEMIERQEEKERRERQRRQEMMLRWTVAIGLIVIAIVLLLLIFQRSKDEEPILRMYVDIDEADTIEKQLEALIEPGALGLIEAPARLHVGQKATVRWRILSTEPKLITKTTVYYDFNSEEETPYGLLDDTSYDFRVDKYLQGRYLVPRVFTGDIIGKKAGTMYLRVYALVDGEHYWSPEYQLSVYPNF